MRGRRVVEAWIRQVFESPEFALAMLPAAVGLGLLASLGSCCNYPIWVALAGYAASREETRRRDALLLPIGFLVGATLFMAVLGAVIGSVGQVLGRGFHFWGTLVAGFVAILFGLTALRVMPVRIPVPQIKIGKIPRGFLSALVFGIVVGGTSIACGLCCGPMLPVAVGMAAAMRVGALGALVLGLFGLGYALPFAAVMAGIRLGGAVGIARVVEGPVRMVAGLVLVGAGFWMICAVL